MRDLFDDFMDELRRREAAARGEDPGPPRSPRGDKDDTDEDADADDADAKATDADVDTDAEPGEDSSDDGDTYTPPRSLDDARRGGRRPPGRGPGGPNDGGPGRAARTGRRIGLYAIVAAIIAVFLLFSVGIDLWTDALWFRSIGFKQREKPLVQHDLLGATHHDLSSTTEVDWEELPLTFDIFSVPWQERRRYLYEGPEIIYTFWAKHGPCQRDGCGHRTPIMSTPVRRRQIADGECVAGGM